MGKITDLFRQLKPRFVPTLFRLAWVLIIRKSMFYIRSFGSKEDQIKGRGRKIIRQQRISFNANKEAM